MIDCVPVDCIGVYVVYLLPVSLLSEFTLGYLADSDLCISYTVLSDVVQNSSCFLRFV